MVFYNRLLFVALYQVALRNRLFAEVFIYHAGSISMHWGSSGFFLGGRDKQSYFLQEDFVLLDCTNENKIGDVSDQLVPGH